MGEGGDAGEGVGVDPAAARAEAERLLAEGNALEDGGDVTAALDKYEAARAAYPDFPRVPLNIANALSRLGRADDAIRTLEDAVTARPDHAAAYFNVGRLHAEQSRHAAAEAAFRSALRIDPSIVEAEVALAGMLDVTGRAEEAEAALKHALAARPDYAGARLNLGQLYFRQDRCDEAEQVLSALEPGGFPPGQVEAARGELYLKMGRHAQAHDAFDAALRADPAGVDNASGLLFALNFRGDLSPDDVFREHARVGALIERAAGPPFAAWNVPWIADRRLRVGYVSGDFIQHPVARFMVPVLAHHDRGAFDVHCFSNRTDADDITLQLRQLAPNWHVIAGESDDAVARRIHALGIDVLVDLSGHTTGHRLGVFARRPAPVQATWLGYLNTTGLRTIDYRICDRHTDPIGETEHLHTERLVRLASAQWCYVPFDGLPRTASPAPSSSDDIVFGSFNQLVKLTDMTLDLWARILHELPRATLAVMDTREGWSRRNLLARLASRGVGAERVRLLPREGLATYFDRVADADIALDTFPYNGATTTFDTLWMGTPIVALRGDRGVARGGCSILAELGLDELVTRTEDDYVRANVLLARDAAQRAMLRRTLRDRLRASPLLDAAAFVRDLESEYRAMWRRRFAAPLPEKPA